MIRRIVCLIIVVGVLLSGFTARASDPEEEKAALAASEKWLSMIDSERYAESREEAAESIRNAVQPRKWEQLIQGAREPLGKIISRKVGTADFKNSLPGAGGGYAVIQFETSFENKKAAVETVTPAKGRDGVWRVSGYYIR